MKKKKLHHTEFLSFHKNFLTANILFCCASEDSTAEEKTKRI